MDQSELWRFINAALEKTNRLLWDQPANARPILEKTGIRHYFDAVDGNDVTNAKPDPEVFLIAAKLLDVNPENAIVFEDSVAGVQPILEK
jgi:beta-phosphoglucomutase